MTNTIKKSSRKPSIAFAAFALLLIAGNTALITNASAAAANAAAPSGGGHSSPSEGGENVPRHRFISPDGHVVAAYDAIRSPVYCKALFLARTGHSDKSQHNFWTKCILGGILPKN